MGKEVGDASYEYKIIVLFSAFWAETARLTCPFQIPWLKMKIANTKIALRKHTSKSTPVTMKRNAFTSYHDQERTMAISKAIVYTRSISIYPGGI